MTLKEAKNQLKPYGITINRCDDEYRVNYKDGEEATLARSTRDLLNTLATVSDKGSAFQGAG